MSLYAGISARHVNSFHQNNSLLFQFILNEFLETFNEMQKLDILCSRSLSPLLSHEIDCRQKDLHLMQESLIQLLGATKDCMRLLSWNFKEGLLTKLRTYCTLFLLNADTDEKELIAIQYYTDKIWHNCHQAIDALHDLPQDYTSLFLALEKASTATQRLAKLIARLIPEFKHDENVIFYVLRNHELFDKTYGNRFTLKLFSKIFPKGFEEGLLFLVKKYTERGFDNVLLVIDLAIKEIEVSPA